MGTGTASSTGGAPSQTASTTRSHFVRTFARYRGLLVAILLTVTCLVVREVGSRAPAYDRHHLPGFDAYVYVAMAEDPAFFTVSPWGYRVLAPLLVHTLWRSDEVRGFHHLSLLGLGLAGPLFFLFLRRQRAPEGLALVATGVFFFSPPVDAVFQNFFLAEPVVLPLLLVALLALESEDRSARPAFVFAAALALAALAKSDVILVLLPGWVAAAIVSRGLLSGLTRTGPGTLAAIAIAWGLRRVWAPYPQLDHPFSIAQVGSAAMTIVSGASQWWAPLFASGFPLALVGLLLPRGRELARRWGLLALLALAIPFGAAVYTGGPSPAQVLFADDVGRLLVYASPFLFAFGLAAVTRGPLSRSPVEPSGSSSSRTARTVVIAGSVLLVAVAVTLPWTRLDPYRRADLRGPKDGPFVLGFCRESLASARRLASHDLVGVEPSGPFFREGWSRSAEYDELTQGAARATVIIPLLEPRDLTVTLELGARSATVVQVGVNGHWVGTVTAEPEAFRQHVILPRGRLFGGDNRLTLEVAEPSALPLTIWSLEVRTEVMEP